MSRPARAKYPGATFSPLYSPVCFLQDFILCKNSYSPNFPKTLYAWFLSDFLKNCNIENGHYEPYIGMPAVMKLIIVIEIQLFKVK